MADFNIEQVFASALEHHRAGRQADAERLYREILARDPGHAGSLYYLGLIAHQLGHNNAAAQSIRQAIAHGFNAAAAHYNLGLILSLLGELDEAIASYRRAISLRPNYPEAFCSLGNALAEKGNGHLDEAAAALRRAIALRPDFPEAFNNLSIALRENGQFDEAVAACRSAIALRPDSAEAFNNLGINLKETGQFDQAIAACRSAIALRPDFAEAFNTLAVALQHAERFDDAIAACRSAIALRPNFAPAMNNLGKALQEKGLLDEALDAYRQAIALDPTSPVAWNNMGIVLAGKGQADEAINAYRQAIAANPDYQFAHSNLLFALHLHPGYDAAAIAEEHRIWNRRHAEPLRQAQDRPIQPAQGGLIRQAQGRPLAGLTAPHSNNPDPGRRLRIGYVSPDFCRHIVGLNLLPFFRHHDRRHFEITCYAQVARPDEITSEFQQHADRWRDIMRVADERLAAQIREDQIDILVDLTLHSADNRLLVFARKPAPVQVTYLSYCGSTGLSAMDYRFSDPSLDPFDSTQGSPVDSVHGRPPDSDLSCYSEKTAHLPRTYWCYQPAGETPDPSPPPALQNGFVTFGCLNNFVKVSSSALDLWQNLLAVAPKSRLILHAPLGNHRDRVLEQFSRRGIESNRVRFVGTQPWAGYIHTYSQIDIALDPFPYGGGITSCDALWMGVPVVTLSGRTAVGRGGRSILSNIGLPDLIAFTPEQYLSIAIELAADLPRLTSVRRGLRERMLGSPLMDAKQFAQDVEAAYRQMWRTWCESHPH